VDPLYEEIEQLFSVPIWIDQELFPDNLLIFILSAVPSGNSADKL